MSSTPPSNALGFGIVGTGMIAGVIARALGRSTGARLTAVSSRRVENARAFAAQYPGTAAVEGHAALFAREDVQAVYIATPTVAKEEITMVAIAAGKHVLVDKPFYDHASVRRMTHAAAAKGLLFMDATHFAHHPRTAQIQAASAATLGTPRSLHTCFYFPFSDRDNIRFRPDQEPMTALGDMAWYSMRAVVEYLKPSGAITQVTTVPEHDLVTGAIIRASGLIAFEGGQVSTYDIGYTAGTVLMDLQLLGTTGVISMDDFVLDWNSSWSFGIPDIPTGYWHRTGMASRKEISFIPTPSATAQEVLMLDHFATLTTELDPTLRNAPARASVQTQEYIDALWEASKVA